MFPRRGPRRASRAFAVARLLVLLLLLAVLWVWNDPSGFAPPTILSTGEELVRETFTRCGIGRGRACVVDGDTFKLGDRKIRIQGIDAPEVHPAQCPEEAKLGEQATVKLLTLLNQGQVRMSGWSHRRRDQYDRELMTVTQKRADGSTLDIGEEMVASGLAHRYVGFKTGWC